MFLQKFSSRFRDCFAIAQHLCADSLQSAVSLELSFPQVDGHRLCVSVDHF